jgi:hypothetical protein
MDLPRLPLAVRFQSTLNSSQKMPQPNQQNSLTALVSKIEVGLSFWADKISERRTTGSKAPYKTSAAAALEIVERKDAELAASIHGYFDQFDSMVAEHRADYTRGADITKEYESGLILLQLVCDCPNPSHRESSIITILESLYSKVPSIIAVVTEDLERESNLGEPRKLLVLTFGMFCIR